MHSLKNKNNRSRSFFLLILSGIITIFIWHIPFGNLIIYPLTILGTWFHEMGHGITAMILGGDFIKLEIFEDGSGIAFYHNKQLFVDENIGEALISAGGLLGAPIVGAILIFVGSKSYLSRISVLVFSIILISSAIIWVRTGVGLVFILAIGIALLILVLKKNTENHQFILQFFGVQACVTTYNDLDYLFKESVVVGAGERSLSDTGEIAHNLFMPYWFWGGLIAFISFLLLLLSLLISYRKILNPKKPKSSK